MDHMTEDLFRTQIKILEQEIKILELGKLHKIFKTRKYRESMEEMRIILLHALMVIETYEENT